MLVMDFLKGVYKLKKNGELPSSAIKFMDKHNLTADMEVENNTLILIAQDLSNKEKRKNIITILLESLKSTTDEVVLKLADLREKTYKQVAKILHPDSSTGDNKSFQVLQEIKLFFWDCYGHPRKEIREGHWDTEKQMREGTYDPYAKYRK